MGFGEELSMARYENGLARKVAFDEKYAHDSAFTRFEVKALCPEPDRYPLPSEFQWGSDSGCKTGRWNSSGGRLYRGGDAGNREDYQDGDKVESEGDGGDQQNR